MTLLRSWRLCESRDWMSLRSDFLNWQSKKCEAVWFKCSKCNNNSTKTLWLCRWHLLSQDSLTAQIPRGWDHSRELMKQSWMTVWIWYLQWRQLRLPFVFVYCSTFIVSDIVIETLISILSVWVHFSCQHRVLMDTRYLKNPVRERHPL